MTWVTFVHFQLSEKPNSFLLIIFFITFIAKGFPPIERKFYRFNKNCYESNCNFYWSFLLVPSSKGGGMLDYIDTSSYPQLKELHQNTTIYSSHSPVNDIDSLRHYIKLKKELIRTMKNRTTSAEFASIPISAFL